MKSQGRVRRARVRSKSKRDRKPTPNPTSGDSTSPQGSEGPSREGALVADACEVRGQRPIVLERPELLEIIQIMRKSHSGPLPAPDDFAAYERVLPGSCERIMAMAESQLNFSHKARTNSELRSIQFIKKAASCSQTCPSARSPRHSPTSSSVARSCRREWVIEPDGARSLEQLMGNLRLLGVSHHTAPGRGVWQSDSAESAVRS